MILFKLAACLCDGIAGQCTTHERATCVSSQGINGRSIRF
jgi:hypothetical protein